MLKILEDLEQTVFYTDDGKYLDISGTYKKITDLVLFKIGISVVSFMVSITNDEVTSNTSTLLIRF